MSQKRKALRLLVAVVAVVVVVALIREWSRSDIDRHLTAIARLRYPPRQGGLWTYFTPDYIRWSLQGRPPVEDVTRERYQHLDALLALGYLERRVFPIKHRTLEIQDASTLHTMAKSRGLVRDGLGYVNFGSDLRSLVVIARPEEMDAWEELIRAFDDETRSTKSLEPKATSR